MRVGCIRRLVYKLCQILLAQNWLHWRGSEHINVLISFHQIFRRKREKGKWPRYIILYHNAHEIYSSDQSQTRTGQGWCCVIGRRGVGMAVGRRVIVKLLYCSMKIPRKLHRNRPLACFTAETTAAKVVWPSALGGYTLDIYFIDITI